MSEPVHGQVSQEVLARVVREHAGQLAASLVSLLGDFSAAEDLVQDAVETALRRWPAEGIPERPDAWLFTVARRRGLDVLRRESTYRAKLVQLTWPAPVVPDDRLRLVFTCCHPALSRAVQIALTLRVVCGLSTAQIAAAFLVPETTVAQRITRAKRKIGEAAIPYRVPADQDLPERLGEVLAVIYLLFNEGYLSSTAERAQARDLVEDAEWLAALLANLMPKEPEAAGLLALIRLHRARGAARFDREGRLVLLADQDRSRWDREAIEEATALLMRTARTYHRPGPYQVALRHLLRPPDHHLLLFAADTTDSATLTAWQTSAREAMTGHGEVHVVTRGHLPHDPADGIFADLRSEAHNRYGVRRPSLYLIRPDKYVGFCGDSVDLEPVNDYFRAWAPAPRKRS
ncbi:DUF6596 domain-containing protein [Streptosporangium sp. NPDC006013]|uniref:RNA polymerase sigma factor n=1 Tax=Streptosporangium sp. NPDC006013 TaxID=3155596 RepID=UPI00339FC40C